MLKDDHDWYQLGMLDEDALLIHLRCGDDPNAADANGRTPLCFAPNVRHAEILCRFGADVNGNRMTAPLFWQMNPEVTQFLLEHGADVHVRDRFGRTPIQTVQDPELAELLLDHGANIQHRDMQGRTALHDVRTAAMAEWLIAHGAAVNALSRNKQTPIETVGDFSIRQLLAAHGGRIHPKKRCDLLHRAKDLRQLEFFLHAGASIRMTDGLGRTALMAHFRHPQIFRVLLEMGSDINARDFRGRTLVHQVRTLHELQMLYHAGADLSVCDNAGNTLQTLFNDPAIQRFLREKEIVFDTLPSPESVLHEKFTPDQEPDLQPSKFYEEKLPPDLLAALASDDADYIFGVLDLYAEPGDLVNVVGYLAQKNFAICKKLLQEYELPESETDAIRQLLLPFAAGPLAELKNILEKRLKEQKYE